MELYPSILDEFAKARIGKFTGDVLIHALSTSYERTQPYISQIHDIFDELLLSAGNNVITDIQKYILYCHQSNSLNIELLYGSKNFKIKQNDSSLLDLDYSPSSVTNMITVRSKGILGTVKIEIFDEAMQKSQMCICYVFIVHCSKAKLFLSPAIFQEMDFTKATFSLYDSYDHLIPTSQFQYMRVSLEIFSLTDMSQKELFKIARAKNDEYSVQGFKSGVYRFILHVQNSFAYDQHLENKLFSNEVEGNVYEKLTTLPNNLLLSPGCSCHLEIIGGPSQKAKVTSNIELRIRRSEEKLIHLTKQEQNLYHVEGSNLGSGIIYFELYQRDTNLTLSSHEVNVQIEFVNNIEIQGFPERKVYLGAKFRLLALSIIIIKKILMFF